MLTDDIDDILADKGDGMMPLPMGHQQGESDDEFDPSSLLSSPLFDESDEALNIMVDLDSNGDGASNSASTIPAEAPSASSNFRGFRQHHQDAMPEMNISGFQQEAESQLMQQAASGNHQDPGFQQQMQSQMQGMMIQGHTTGFEGSNGFDVHQNMANNPQQFSSFEQQNSMGQGGMMGMGALSNQLPILNQQHLLEMQQNVQDVKQQMQNLQDGAAQFSSQMEQSQQQQQQQQFQAQQQNMLHQQQNMLQGMHSSPSKNVAGTSRAPPGRSISMPAQRLGNPQTTQFSNSFVMQQQQQQQNAMQALSQSMNSTSSDHGNAQQQQQLPVHMDLSTRSVPTDVSGDNMLGMMQQATMAGVNGAKVSFAGGVVRNNSLPMRNNSLAGASGEGGLDLAAMAQSYAASQTNGGQQQGNVNEAMEKLCESMRRSAMSRTLVKQLSGRTLNRTSSGRSIQRTNSGRRNLVRASSGRQISRASSGKALQRNSLSGRQVMLASGADGVGELHPVRRMAQDPKHRMTPTRGVFRHHSSTAAMGVNSLAAMQQQLPLQQQSFGASSHHNQMDPSSLHSMEENRVQKF